MPISIVIVEHFPVVRAGIRNWLSSYDEFDIVGETSRAEEGVRMVRELHPDIMLLDLVALRRLGYEHLPTFRAAQPLLPVLILNGRPEHVHALELMGGTASGYFPPDGCETQLVDAIRTICNGRCYVADTKATRPPDSQEQTSSRHQALTPRELQVFHSMCRGERPTQTADRLSLSLSTVNRYRKLVFRKMDVQGVPGLIRYAVSQGIEVFPE